MVKNTYFFFFDFAQTNVLIVAFLRQLYMEIEDTVSSYILTSKYKLRGKLEIIGSGLQSNYYIH